jgi:hypothetical protein
VTGTADSITVIAIEPGEIRARSEYVAYPNQDPCHTAVSVSVTNGRVSTHSARSSTATGLASYPVCHWSSVMPETQRCERGLQIFLSIESPSSLNRVSIEPPAQHKPPPHLYFFLDFSGATVFRSTVEYGLRLLLALRHWMRKPWGAFPRCTDRWEDRFVRERDKVTHDTEQIAC